MSLDPQAMIPTARSRIAELQQVLKFHLYDVQKAKIAKQEAEKILLHARKR
jgi:hypothetical protein